MQKVFKIHLLLIFVAIFALFDSAQRQSLAQSEQGPEIQDQRETGSNSGLPIPRFVSIATGKARARTGPGLKYPVEWVYQRDGLPVQVIKEFDNWRKILDIDGQGGWIHVSLLSGERTALVNTSKYAVMREAPNKKSEAIALLESDLVVEIERCLDQWCRVRRADFSGWVERNLLWGIYEDEQIN